MATVQVQRPAKTVTVEEQSVVSIQTCIRASISALLFRRRCLPDRAFKKRDYRSAGPDVRAAGMMVLERGKSYRADCLLDWLDGPALDALRAGKLRGLQICIHPNPSKRSRVLETYSFGIWYEGLGARSAPDNVGLELNKLLETIDKFCDALPALPSTRFLSMNLFLLQAPDQVDTIPDFDKLENQQLQFPESEDWLRQCDTFRHISSAYHRTSLRVSYTDLQHGTAIGQEPAHPSAAQYVRLVPVDHDLECLAQLAKPPSTTHTARAKNGATETPHSSLGSSENAVFSVRAMEIRQALQAMQEAEELSQGDTIPDASVIATQQMLSERSQQLGSLVRLQYRKNKLRILRGHEESTRQETRGIAREIGGTTKQGQIILCTCGYAVEEGHLLQCQCCETWQHAHCHGFVGMHDPRIPERHFCYICALNPGDAAQSSALLKLILPRRAVYNAVNYGIYSKTEFVKHLNCSADEATPIFNYLRSSGLFVAAVASHKAGFKAMGLPSWVPAGWGNREKVLDQYFDPTSAISDYFEDIPVKPSQLVNILTFPDQVQMPEGVMPRGLREQTDATRGRKRPRRARSGFDSDDEDMMPGCRKAIGRGITVPVHAVDLKSANESRSIVLESKQVIDVASDASPQ